MADRCRRGFSPWPRCSSTDVRVLRWNTVAEDLDWLPEDGVALSRADLERIFIDLRTLIGGTAELDPNRAHAVDIAVTLTQALERDRGDDQ